jgi:hypothetical protein
VITSLASDISHPLVGGANYDPGHP